MATEAGRQKEETGWKWMGPESSPIPEMSLALVEEAWGRKLNDPVSMSPAQHTVPLSNCGATIYLSINSKRSHKPQVEMGSRGALEKWVSHQLRCRGRVEEGEIVSRSGPAHPSHSVEGGWEPVKK